MLTFFFTILVLSACSTVADNPGSNPNNPTTPVGTEWKSADIGGTDLGHAEFENGRLKVSGAGDLSDRSDEFYFHYLEAEGEVSIVARLTEHGATLPNSWPKAGITIRDSLDPGSANMTIYAISNDQFNGLVVQGRRSGGGSTSVIGTRSGATTPLWLRLMRSGNSVVAEISNDGENWTEVASDSTIQLSGSVYLGPVVASGRDNNSAIDAVYQDLKVVDADGGDLPGTPNPDPDPNPGPKSETTYQIDSSSNFLNPERGFHSEVDLFSGSGFDNVRGRGYTLVRSYVRLDDYRNSAIPSDFLNNLRNGLARARTAGVKIILRFSYNFGNAPDAPLNRVLEHIDQLEPILHEYSDVIAVLQGGFIGAWGEWHGSTNGLTSAANKRTIGQALLDAMPDSRMVQVRAPFHRRDIVGSPDPNVELFGDSYQARLGFKNDCFLSTDSDAGTYGGDQVRDRNETEQFTVYTAVGGETCAIGFPSSRQDCVVALDELAQFHWDYLNSGFHSGVLNRWRDQGCYDEIARRLGYRLGLQTAAVTAEVNAGGTLTLDLRMRNDGFGKVYNPRPIDIVLRNTATGQTHTVRAVADARTILPLAGEIRDIQLSVTLPGDLAAGAYEVLLGMPDADATLAGDARYNIRLANVGTWQESTGLNALGLTTQVR